MALNPAQMNSVSERERLKVTISDLAREASHENWDGDGGLAVHPETVGIATRFVDLVPGDIPDPDVAATPQGEIDFDWTFSRDLMLTVSVGENSDIAFAGVFDGDRLNGHERWASVIPEGVANCLERLRNCLGQ